MKKKCGMMNAECGMKRRTESRARFLFIPHSSFRIPHFLKPLSHGFVKDDACRDRDVERRDVAAKGNAYERIAALAYETVQPRAFAAEKERARRGPVPAGIGKRSIRARSHRPDASLFKLLYQAGEVRRAGHGDVLQSSGSRLRHRLGQTGGAALRNKDGVRARTLRRPDDRAEVARVFYPIERDDERRINSSDARRKGIENMICVAVPGCGNRGDDALMVGSRPDHAIKVCARGAANGNVCAAGQLHQLAQAMLMCAFGNRDVLYGAHAAAQGLDDGAHAVKLRARFNRARASMTGRDRAALILSVWASLRLRGGQPSRGPPAFLLPRHGFDPACRSLR